MPSIEYKGEYTPDAVKAEEIQKEKLFDTGKEGRREKMLMLHHLAHEYYQEREKYNKYSKALEYLLPENIRIWLETFMTFMAHVNTDKKLVTDDQMLVEGRLDLRKLTLEHKKLSDFSEDELNGLELTLSSYSGEWRQKEAEIWDFIEENFEHLGRARIAHIGNFFQNFQGKPNPEFARTIIAWIGKDAFDRCDRIRTERIEIMRRCVRDVYVFVLGEDYIKDYPLAQPYVETRNDYENFVSNSLKKMRDLRRKYNKFGGILLEEHPDLNPVMVDDINSVYSFMIFDILLGRNKKRILFNKSIMLEARNLGVGTSTESSKKVERRLALVKSGVERQVKLDGLVTQIKESLSQEGLEGLIPALWHSYKMAKLAAQPEYL